MSTTPNMACARLRGTPVGSTLILPDARARGKGLYDISGSAQAASVVGISRLGRPRVSSGGSLLLRSEAARAGRSRRPALCGCRPPFFFASPFGKQQSGHGCDVPSHSMPGGDAPSHTGPSSGTLRPWTARTTLSLGLSAPGHLFFVPVAAGDGSQATGMRGDGDGFFYGGAR